jgi:hypothetical protein
MTRDELIDALVVIRDCDEVMKWVRNTPGDPAELWQSSECAGHLLWLAIHAGVDRQSVSLALCDCVRIVLPFAKSDTPRHTIEIIEEWTRGAATSAQVLAAAEAAEAAAEAAEAAAEAADAAAYADAAAAAAAYAVATAAYEASAVATAAYEASAVATAAYVAAAVATFDARHSTQRCCADLIRARIPWSLVEAALEAAQ